MYPLPLPEPPRLTGVPCLTGISCMGYADQTFAARRLPLRSTPTGLMVGRPLHHLNTSKELPRLSNLTGLGREPPHTNAANVALFSLPPTPTFQQPVLASYSPAPSRCDAQSAPSTPPAYPVGRAGTSVGTGRSSLVQDCSGVVNGGRFALHFKPLDHSAQRLLQFLDAGKEILRP